jgi:hypothetical protein
MKKLFLILAILVFAVPAMAQTWHTANQVTVAWDAVAPPKDAQGADLPGAIKYQAYIKFQDAAATPVPVGGVIDETQQVISFSNEGRYFVCAQTLRFPPDETEPQKSAIACSDNAAVCSGGVPFGVKFFIAPGSPGGLKFQP